MYKNLPADTKKNLMSLACSLFEDYSRLEYLQGYAPLYNFAYQRLQEFFGFEHPGLMRFHQRM